MPTHTTSVIPFLLYLPRILIFGITVRKPIKHLCVCGVVCECCLCGKHETREFGLEHSSSSILFWDRS